ncbi:hypothetical protein [Butyrivibrio sp. INlla16]|uniref:hypothetical protein n=1 Tax=Butyrivibrio sp. INlla16 TaxID=1520807 RepID=UPI001A9A66D7|nr:hypothetical protein [Butyrivibrio sp. INlla16]
MSAIIVSTLFLYASQMIFKTFVPGVVVDVFFALLFPAYLIVKRDLKEIRDSYFSTGFYVFLGMFLLTVIVDYGYFFWHWDELSHWGMMVKEMFRTGRFYTEDVCVKSSCA